jgi:hypothetical protein
MRYKQLATGICYKKSPQYLETTLSYPLQQLLRDQFYSTAKRTIRERPATDNLAASELRQF